MSKKRPTLSLLEEWGSPEPSPLREAADAFRATGAHVIDLIGATPQEHGLEFPPEFFQRIAAQAATIRGYAPDPLGQPDARNAIATWYADRITTIPADRICLTPGTSLAYLYLFRILADGGGDILVPSPTYPLFADIARLAGAKTRSYHLALGDGGRWLIDPEEVRFQVRSTTRAIVLVSPHNPTGHCATKAELAGLAAICRDHNLPLIVDEVFCEFLEGAHGVLERPAALGDEFPLVATLNGFSKMYALPGMKVAWIALSGDPARTTPLIHALAYASDTFLPVSELSQAMVAPIMEGSNGVSKTFARAYRYRRSIARELMAGSSVALPHVEGGVYQLLRLPPEAVREDFALEAVRREGILTHPGPYYGLGPEYLVTTVVPGVPVLRRALPTLSRMAERP